MKNKDITPKVRRGPIIHTAILLTSCDGPPWPQRPEPLIFLQQRSFRMEVFPGCWETPGGKLEDGEREEDASLVVVRRELREELGVDFAQCVHFPEEDRRVQPFATGVELFRKPQTYETVPWAAFVGLLRHPVLPLQPDARVVSGFGWFPLREHPATVTPITRAILNHVHAHQQSMREQLRSFLEIHHG